MLKERQSLEGSPSTPDECAGCGARIQDRFYLLAVDRQWHGTCLRCCECRLPLDTELTCFSRDGNIYCKDDYYRMFCVKRCARCGNGITANELVMRARDMVYHLTCFTCIACGTLLSKGDVFGMRDGLVYCRPHYDNACMDEYCEDDMNSYRCQDMHSEGESQSQFYNGGPSHKGRPRKRKLAQGSPEDMQTMRMTSTALELLHRGDLSSSMESLAYDSSVASPGSVSSHTQRTKRMRTSFKHHQLRTMKSYFAINQNPDAKDLKQLAQKTGLSKRVLQVWFQNARAKWRRNIMRQESNQHGPMAANGNPGHSGNTSLVPGPVSTNGVPSAMMLGEPLQGLDDLRVHTPHPISFNELY
ncbi:PREDICTED: LIM/homeobox protein Lhx9-like [Papilio polytes]|uniref:LIM/homeobox protein Lhx9-like n=1 Tax=Papilio polytes TaxID=76194 RepID=UPI0006766DEA|nr:PREDICTED: LIM/homeobox protein Lhx9-like [Papilio polytes]XP_013147487.1 PREDICTED: LIM/homeobox protein Lhx9-like [Papilio polytes]XP_013147488.1 PREDICTED: LIM/homeobox protein Lhx9-like [Papilio polytes]